MVLYHLLPLKDWQQAGAGPYRPASLATEGFIHCAHAHQVARIANLFYREVPDLLVLCVASERLTSAVREEDVGGERFPHVYGPINPEAVVAVRPLERSATGDWQFA